MQDKIPKNRRNYTMPKLAAFWAFQDKKATFCMLFMDQTASFRFSPKKVTEWIVRNARRR
jgi:hypothetical protein